MTAGKDIRLQAALPWLALVAMALLVMAGDASARQAGKGDQAFEPGLKVGDKIPSFQLKNQDGKPVDFASAKGPKGAALLFYRSADWCPYCKTQLAQLQQAIPGYQQQGLGVIAISYDTPEVLQTFAKRVGITYTMLSDPDSATIKAFGLLNKEVPVTSDQFGIPYPGMYIVDAAGKITAKYFEESYRERFTPDSIITRDFGAAGGRQVEVKTEHLTLTTSASREKVAAGNRITLVAEIQLPAKMHVYAPGVQGYKPVAFVIDRNPDVAPHDARFPASKTLLLPAIKERVPVYENKVRITRDVTISGTAKGPEVTIQGHFDYQACDDQICYTPKSVPVTFTLQLQQLDRERVPEAMRRKAPGTPQNQ